MPVLKSKSTGQKQTKKPYIIGICGGPSSGMSTVAYTIRDNLQNNSGIQSAVIKLADFYIPIRGDMRRRSRASSLADEDAEKIDQELKKINQNTDFDDPKQIDFDLLIVRTKPNFIERAPPAEGEESSFQQAHVLQVPQNPP